MPKLVEGYTELGCGRLKKGKGFLKPNFDLLPNLKTFLVGTLVVFLLNKSLVCT
jgi:hypothetical protein